MTKIKFFYEEKGKSFSVWFDDPEKEVVSEEVGDGVILSKDKDGKIIGFEKLYVDLSKQKEMKSLPFEFTIT